jgi:hypothetical protein
LRKEGIDLKDDIVSIEELVELLWLWK